MAKACSIRNDVDADEVIVNGDKKLGMVARVFSLWTCGTKPNVRNGVETHESSVVCRWKD